MKISARVSLALLIAAMSCGSVGADEKEIKYKSRDLEKVKTELTTKKEEKQRLEKEAEALSREVKEGEAKITNIEKSLIYTKNRTFQVSQDLAQAKSQRDTHLTNLEDNRAAILKTTRQYQIASIAGLPQSPQPVYLKQILNMKVQDRKALKKQTAESTSDLNELIDTQQALRGEVGRQESRLNNLKSGKAEKQRVLTKKKTRAEVLETEVTELRQTAQELESLIDVLRTKAKEDKAAEAKIRAQKQLSGHSPILVHSLPWPVKGTVKVNFGRQDNSSVGAALISNGITIESKLGNQPVQAVGNGKVLYVGIFMSYGSMVVLEHPGDWFSVYGQLGKWIVEKGQEIKKGDPVGFSPPADNSKTYFELRFYGKPTDPMPWLVRQN